MIEERFYSIWKENWNRRELIAGDISGFTKWFFIQGYNEGIKKAVKGINNSFTSLDLEFKGIDGISKGSAEQILVELRDWLEKEIGNSPQMNKGESVNKIEDNILLEKLSDLEHQQWCDFMNYLFDKSFGQICARSKKWMEQCQTDYKDLSEEDKEKDRVFARKVIELLKSTNNYQISNSGYPQFEIKARIDSIENDAHKGKGEKDEK